MLVCPAVTVGAVGSWFAGAAFSIKEAAPSKTPSGSFNEETRLVASLLCVMKGDNFLILNRCKIGGKGTHADVIQCYLSELNYLFIYQFINITLL